MGLIMSTAARIDPDLMDEEIASINRKKKKTDEEALMLSKLLDRSLPAGAKTYCESLVKQLMYGYEDEVTSKYMTKGIMVEDCSIQLINDVFFTAYQKNTERKWNDWLTGECDIFAGTKIIDVKSSWSVQTFPASQSAAKDVGYEWQGRAYMMLWDVDQFEVIHCLVNTPEELIGYENEKFHIVDYINPELRVTRVCYERDKSLEDKIKQRVEDCREYMAGLITKIAEEHTF